MSAADVPRRVRVEQVMGMPVSIQLRGAAAAGASAGAAVAEVIEWLSDVDRVFSTYRTGSDVSRLARGELALADCDPRVRDVAALCAGFRDRTGGAFDAARPAAGGPGRPALDEPIHDRPVFDPTGLVKGWAAERAGRRLAEVDGCSSCLNAGGDVVVGGRAAEDPDAVWRIGVEDPADPLRLLAVVPIAVGAVATSGGAHRGDHIVDPRTGAPARDVAAVTVVGPSLLECDVLATAAVVHGADAVDWLDAQPGVEGLVVGRNGVRTTRGWPGGTVTA